jgi:hypothetical protein
MAIPFLAVIGLAAAAAGGIGTAVNTAKKNRERNNMRDKIYGDLKENETWYKANAMADYTQRADAQNLFKNLRDNLKRNRNATTAAATVTGATPAQVAAAKEADAKAISDTYASVAAMGQQYKDNITNQYFNRKNYLRSQDLNLGHSYMDDFQRSADAWTNISGSGMKTAAGSFA